MNEVPSKLSRVKSAASIAQSVFTVGAIIAAGIWFYIQKEASPKANIDHKVTHRQIDDDWTWVHISITISNPGKRLLNLESGIIRIQKIMPLSKEIRKMIKNNKSPISQKSYRVPWPTIGKSYKPQLNIKIQPGEDDTLDYEFIVPSKIRTVKIYSYFTKQQKPPIGWGKSTIYDITRKINKVN